MPSLVSRLSCALAACVLAAPLLAETVAEARLRLLRGDPSAVEDTIRRAAEAGHSQAMNLLADAHQHGVGVPQDNAAALDWYQRSAAAGWPHAYANLGDIFADGELGLDPDPMRAVQMFEAGLRVDFDGAVAIEYAAFLRNSEPPWRDPARALRLVEEAAAMGKSRAVAELGFYYATGTLVDEDLARALALFEQADAQGHPKAARNLGYMYDDGVGVEEDDERALQYYLRGADAGDSEAMADAAFMLWFGEAGVEDRPRAMELARRGLTRQQAKAYEFMGDRAYFGEMMDEDRALAAEYYAAAWARGRPYSAYALGWQYANGDGIEQDIQRGAELYRAAAERGNAEAAFELGAMMRRGDVEGEPSDMIAFLEQAAEAGKAAAVNELGLVYEYGEGVPVDMARAQAFYEQAADMGDPWARRNVGIMLLDAEAPSDADIARAEALFQTAADEGVSEAWASLAALHRDGVGRPVDRDTALRLFRRSGEEGYAHGYVDAAEMILADDPGPLDIVRARGFFNKAAEADAHALQHLGDAWRAGTLGPVDMGRAHQSYLTALKEVGDADAAARLAQMAVAGEGPFADGAARVEALSYCLYAERRRSEFAVDCAPLATGLSADDTARADDLAGGY
ncbi:SEL1-like repeat protein [Pseudaestuariivita atlantica]|uniref:Sel1 repeat family protein n=1 Tax=Pseudaestuariivita atlantica TaxID=1317121 RepID=A0A0L1JMS2_9RHOB|nr:SEL1-like repeat protein [Pseudaestuariivita atlantica]KNG93049.1 hypothetical protein ATO11_14100 [Pseudaestuariivita atlantica]